MRVTVAYRVDIGDVPSELRRLVTTVSRQLDACAVVSSSLQDKEEVSDVLLSTVEDLQSKIADVQQTLDDVSGIARGYLSAISIGNKGGEDDNLDRNQENDEDR